MSYTFVKLEDKKLTSLQYPWMLQCSDNDTLDEHNNLYMKSTIEAGVKDIMRHFTKGDHYSTDWAIGIYVSSLNTNGNWIESATKLEHRVLSDKIKAMLTCGTIYLRDSGSYMTAPKNKYRIKQQIVMSSMKYPNYSESDINIRTWDGGRHYYAKIGNLDVVDSKGDQKWNTHKAAMEAAKKELKNFSM